LIVGGEKHVKSTGNIFLAIHGRKLQERRPFMWLRNSTGCHLSLIRILNPTKLV